MDKAPTSADSSLPIEVVTSLQRGDTIDAIRRLREARGIGLKEAKDLIDAHTGVGVVPAALPPERMRGGLPADVADAIRRGDKIEAIKLLRAHEGMGLAEAKQAIEQEQEKQSARDMPAPGVVTASGKYAWLFVVALIALVAWLFLFPRT